MTRRYDIKAILRDPVKRRWLLVRCLIAIQAREGRYLTLAEAEAVYDRAAKETR